MRHLSSHHVRRTTHSSICTTSHGTRPHCLETQSYAIRRTKVWGYWSYTSPSSYATSRIIIIIISTTKSYSTHSTNSSTPRRGTCTKSGHVRTSELCHIRRLLSSTPHGAHTITISTIIIINIAILTGRVVVVIIICCRPPCGGPCLWTTSSSIPRHAVRLSGERKGVSGCIHIANYFNVAVLFTKVQQQ